MGTLIGIVGESGRGKSTSLRNLDPSETFIINVAGKALPIRGYKKKYLDVKTTDMKTGNYVETHNPDTIYKFMKMVSDKRPEIKVLVVEDSSYVTSFEIFDRAKESSYTKQVEIADHYARILRTVQELRDDLFVVIVTHPDVERDAMGEITNMKIKTYGKMTDKYMSLDGLFTYIFFAQTLVNEEPGGAIHTRYVFDTNDPRKISTAKSPFGVFEERYIDNDIAAAINAIQAYNDGE